MYNPFEHYGESEEEPDIEWPVVEVALPGWPDHVALYSESQQYAFTEKQSINRHDFYIVLQDVLNEFVNLSRKEPLHPEIEDYPDAKRPSLFSLNRGAARGQNFENVFGPNSNFIHYAMLYAQLEIESNIEVATKLDTTRLVFFTDFIIDYFNEIVKNSKNQIMMQPIKEMLQAVYPQLTTDQIKTGFPLYFGVSFIGCQNKLDEVQRVLDCLDFDVTPAVKPQGVYESGELFMLIPKRR